MNRKIFGATLILVLAMLLNASRRPPHKPRLPHKRL